MLQDIGTLAGEEEFILFCPLNSQLSALWVLLPFLWSFKPYLYFGVQWNPIENVLVRHGILLPDTVIFIILNPIKINGMSAPLSSLFFWPQRVIGLMYLKSQGQRSQPRCMLLELYECEPDWDSLPLFLVQQYQL